MRTLLLLPGLLEDADLFARPIEAMQPSIRCVVADLTRSDTIAGMARDALAQAPAGAMSLVGHSMGGYVALEILRQAPERIERLALLNTHARPDSPEATENRRRLVALAERDFEQVPAALLPRVVNAAHYGDSIITGTITEMALGVGRDAFIRQERAIVSRIDSRPHLAAIRCPTLVIAAREDDLMPLAWLQELSEGIPGARIEVVEDSGNTMPIEQPEAVTELLARWFA